MKGKILFAAVKTAGITALLYYSGRETLALWFLAISGVGYALLALNSVICIEEALSRQGIEQR